MRFFVLFVGIWLLGQKGVAGETFGYDEVSGVSLVQLPHNAIAIVYPDGRAERLEAPFTTIKNQGGIPGFSSSSGFQIFGLGSRSVLFAGYKFLFRAGASGKHQRYDVFEDDLSGCEVMSDRDRCALIETTQFDGQTIAAFYQGNGGSNRLRLWDGVQFSDDLGMFSKMKFDDVFLLNALKYIKISDVKNHRFLAFQPFVNDGKLQFMAISESGNQQHIVDFGEDLKFANIKALRINEAGDIFVGTEIFTEKGARLGRLWRFSIEEGSSLKAEPVKVGVADWDEAQVQWLGFDRSGFAYFVDRKTHTLRSLSPVDQLGELQMNVHGDCEPLEQNYGLSQRQHWLEEKFWAVCKRHIYALQRGVQVYAYQHDQDIRSIFVRDADSASLTGLLVDQENTIVRFEKGIGQKVESVFGNPLADARDGDVYFVDGADFCRTSKNSKSKCLRNQRWGERGKDDFTIVSQLFSKDYVWSVAKNVNGTGYVVLRKDLKAGSKFEIFREHDVLIAATKEPRLFASSKSNSVGLWVEQNGLYELDDLGNFRKLSVDIEKLTGVFFPALHEDGWLYAVCKVDDSGRDKNKFEMCSFSPDGVQHNLGTLSIEQKIKGSGIFPLSRGAIFISGFQDGFLMNHEAAVKSSSVFGELNSDRYQGFYHHSGNVYLRKRKSSRDSEFDTEYIYKVDGRKLVGLGQRSSVRILDDESDMNRNFSHLLQLVQHGDALWQVYAGGRFGKVGLDAASVLFDSDQLDSLNSISSATKHGKYVFGANAWFLFRCLEKDAAQLEVGSTRLLAQIGCDMISFGNQARQISAIDEDVIWFLSGKTVYSVSFADRSVSVLVDNVTSDGFFVDGNRANVESFHRIKMSGSWESLVWQQNGSLIGRRGNSIYSCSSEDVCRSISETLPENSDEEWVFGLDSDDKLLAASGSDVYKKQDSGEWISCHLEWSHGPWRSEQIVGINHGVISTAGSGVLIHACDPQRTSLLRLPY